MRLPIVILTGMAAVFATVARADEGMWTFDNFPFELLRERYGVRVDDAWLERVRLGCTSRGQADPCMPNAEAPDTRAQTPERTEVERDREGVGLKQRVGGAACPCAHGNEPLDPHPSEPGHREFAPRNGEAAIGGGRTNASGHEVGHDQSEREPEDHDGSEDDDRNAKARGHVRVREPRVT